MKLYLGTIQHREGFFQSSHRTNKSFAHGMWDIQVQYEVIDNTPNKITIIYACAEDKGEAIQQAVKQLKEKGYAGSLRLVPITQEEVEENYEWQYERKIPNHLGRLALMKGLE